MSRQTRIIVLLLVIAAVGVGGLMFVANQYKKALSGRTGRSGPVDAGVR